MAQLISLMVNGKLDATMLSCNGPCYVNGYQLTMLRRTTKYIYWK